MILRYILNDNEKMALISKEIIQNNKVSITIEVLAEVVFVLNGKIYNKPRNEIKTNLLIFLEEIDYENLPLLKVALETYAENNLDFVDCILFAYHKVKNCEICTFDKRLNKLIQSFDSIE